MPDLDNLNSKIDNIKDKFDFFSGVETVVKGFQEQIFVNGSAPSVSVDFHNANSKYDFGGEMKILDLSWYAPFKPVGDILIAGFCWLLFIWKYFKKAHTLLSNGGAD